MLLSWVLVALSLKHLQRLNQALAGFAGLNNGIDVAAFGCDVGVGEAVGELFNLLLAGFGAVFGSV